MPIPVAREMNAAASVLLDAANRRPKVQDRLLRLARRALTHVEMKVLAAEIADVLGEKSSGVYQRLSELRRGVGQGGAWLLSSPERLAAFAAACGLDASQLGARVRTSIGAWHPAWDELDAGPAVFIDPIPGLGSIDDLANRAKGLREGDLLAIRGEPGAGVSTALVRLGGLLDLAVETVSSIPSKSDGVVIVELGEDDEDGLVNLVRERGLRVVVGARGQLRGVTTLTLDAWGKKEIGALVAKLSSTFHGQRLLEVSEATWEQLAQTRRWRPRELGFVLRAIADEPTLAGGSRDRLPLAVIEGVASARPDALGGIDPAQVRDSFVELALRQLAASQPGRWPEPLERSQVRHALQTAGGGRSPVVSDALSRDALAAVLQDVRVALGTKHRELLRRLDHSARVLENPTLDSMEAALVELGIAARAPRGLTLDVSLAAWVCARRADGLEGRIGDTSLRPVLLGAVDRFPSPNEMVAAARETSGAFLCSLRVLLALAAHAEVALEGAHARIVVGSAVALARSWPGSPWLSDGAVSDIRACSRRYGAELSGEIVVHPAVARWLEVTGPHALVARAELPAPALLLPFQHIDDVLRDDIGVGSEIEDEVLALALEAGDRRAIEIVAGIATDPHAMRVGHRRPVIDRLKCLRRNAPRDWQEHQRALRVIIGRAERWDEDTHAAVAEAVAGLVSSAPDIESAERALLDDGPVALMVLDALRRTRAREWLTRWWSRIWTRLEPQLSAAQDRFPAPGPTVVDRWCTFEVADALADLGDMSALHTLAELGRETLAHADPSEPSTMSTRRLLARRAVLLLARRHDLELLAKLPPMDERNNVVRAAFEDVCRGDIGVSRWAATNSDEREAGYAVTQAAGTDAACRALARAWVADPNAADWRRCKSAEALLRGDITREDETALVGWFDEDGNRASWVSSALGTSSKRVHEAAIGWIERWLDGRVSLGATSTPATARGLRDAWWLEGAMKKLATRPPKPRALAILARVMNLTVAVAADDLIAWEVLRVMISLDRDEAARWVSATATRHSGFATRLAHRWVSSERATAPPAIVHMTDHGASAARAKVLQLTDDQLAEVARKLPTEAWALGAAPEVGTAVERNPSAVLVAYAARDAEGFTKEAVRRAKDLESEPTKLFALAEWLLGINADAAIQVLNQATAPLDAPGTVRRSRRRS